MVAKICSTMSKVGRGCGTTASPIVLDSDSETELPTECVEPDQPVAVLGSPMKVIRSESYQ